MRQPSGGLPGVDPEMLACENTCERTLRRWSRLLEESG